MKWQSRIGVIGLDPYALAVGAVVGYGPVVCVKWTDVTWSWYAQMSPDVVCGLELSLFTYSQLVLWVGLGQHALSRLDLGVPWRHRQWSWWLCLPVACWMRVKEETCCEWQKCGTWYLTDHFSPECYSETRIDFFYLSWFYCSYYVYRCDLSTAF